jgi:putative heme-binding domain-containing protein
MTKTSLFLVGVAAAWGSALLLSTPVRAQQHGYSAAQVDEGRRLYGANCGRCHNDTGDGVPGVELFKQIRRATSDDDVAKLIQNGIPGTSMPSHNFSTAQALNVVAFLRTMASGGVPVSAAAAPATGTTVSGLTGDAASGKTIVEGKGGCLTCHSIGGAGGTGGPDLAAAVTGGRAAGAFAVPPTAAALERSLLDPDADVAIPYRVFQVTTKGGQTVRGTLLNQDTFSVQMRDASGELRAFQKSDLTQSGFLPSAMPSYRGRLAPQEIADVVAYLLSLRGQRR